MSERLDSESYQSSHKIGQDNVKILGFDIHNPVFFLCASLVLVFAGATLLDPAGVNGALSSARSWTIRTFYWLFAATPVVTVLFCVAFAASPLGRIRLGGVDAKPDFGLASWIAMLFAAGVGVGYMFYGAAEPLSFYTGASGAPLDVAPATDDARRLSLSTATFHWGLWAWGVYAIVGLTLGFFAYNKGLPLTIRSAFYPLLGDRVWGWPGHIIDLFAVTSTIFGLATSIGLGATQATSGLAYLFGLTPTVTMQLALIATITGLAVVSVIRGMDGGVKLLSNINMALAFALLVFVVLMGPTTTILTAIADTAKNYVLDTPRLTNWFGRTDTDFFYGWTIFYWAWWIAWAPFVGMFIARISKGRTIRQYVATTLIAPVIIGAIWFTAFGVSAIEQYDAGLGDIANGVTDASLTLFHLLANLPLSEVTSTIAILLLLVFITTSADSGALVVDSITAGGKTTAPVFQRIFWALMLGLTAAMLLFSGGTEALNALQAGTILAALPFSIVLLVCCVSLYKGLRAEERVLRGATRSEKK